MVDFSLTETDRRLMDLMHEEYEIGRRYAREIDRTAEHKQPTPRKTHPDLAGTESPYKLLQKDPQGISGDIMTEALMHMVSARDVSLREEGITFGALVVNDFGTEEQKKSYGHLRLAIGLTEPGAGSDPRNMAST
jgi:acyl-CoA dehydrogenase